MTRVQEQLRNQSLDDVSLSAFKQVGGVIYPDASANSNLKAFNSILQAFQNVHLPTFSQIIPNTATKVEHTPTITGAFETVVNPSTNQVIEVQAFQIVNSSVAPVSFQIGCSDVACYQQVADPTATYTVQLQRLPRFTSGQGHLVFNQIDGSVGDLTVTVVYSFIIQ